MEFKFQKENLVIDKRFSVMTDYTYTCNILCCTEDTTLREMIEDDGVQIFTLKEKSQLPDADDFVSSHISKRKYLCIDLNHIDFNLVEDLLLRSPFYNTNCILFLDSKFLNGHHVSLPFQDNINNPLYVNIILNITGDSIDKRKGYVNSDEVCFE